MIRDDLPNDSAPDLPQDNTDINCQLLIKNKRICFYIRKRETGEREREGENEDEREKDEIK